MRNKKMIIGVRVRVIDGFNKGQTGVIRLIDADRVSCGVDFGDNVLRFYRPSALSLDVKY